MDRIMSSAGERQALLSRVNSQIQVDALVDTAASRTLKFRNQTTKLKETRVGRRRRSGRGKKGAEVARRTQSCHFCRYLQHNYGSCQSRSDESCAVFAKGMQRRAYIFGRTNGHQRELNHRRYVVTVVINQTKRRATELECSLARA